MIKNFLLLAIVVVSFVWFPFAYERLQNGTSDFNIYMSGPENEHWYYNNWVAYPCQVLDTEEPSIGFAIFYSLGVLSWLLIARKYPLAGLLGAYPILIGLEAGNVGPILAGLCLWFPGAILATLVKPYLVVFVVVHAVLGYHRFHARARRLPGWYPLGVAQKR